MLCPQQVFAAPKCEKNIIAGIKMKYGTYLHLNNYPKCFLQRSNPEKSINLLKVTVCFIWSL